MDTRATADESTRLSLEAHAGLMAELAAAGEARAQVLAKHGLDEDQWEAIDGVFQAQLSEALAQEGDGLHPLVAAHAAAYEAARRALAAPISLERFAEVTRLFSATGDIRAALARVGVTMSEYVAASSHWSRRMAEDPATEGQLQRALGPR